MIHVCWISFINLLSSSCSGFWWHVDWLYQFLHAAVHSDAPPAAQKPKGCLLFLQCAHRDTADRADDRCTHPGKTGINTDTIITKSVMGINTRLGTFQFVQLLLNEHHKSWGEDCDPNKCLRYNMIHLFIYFVILLEVDGCGIVSFFKFVRFSSKGRKISR